MIVSLCTVLVMDRPKQLIAKTLHMCSPSFIKRSKEDADNAYLSYRVVALCNEVEYNDAHKYCDNCMVLECPSKHRFKYDLLDYLIPYCPKCEMFVDDYTVVKAANSQVLQKRSVLSVLNI